MVKIGEHKLFRGGRKEKYQARNKQKGRDILALFVLLIGFFFYLTSRFTLFESNGDDHPIAEFFRSTPIADFLREIEERIFDYYE